MRLLSLALVLSLAWPIAPTLAQITVLDQAQDAAQSGTTSTAPANRCGTRPFTIARMSWPSSQLLAEIHARILTQEFGCQVQVIPGDLAATASSMGSSGQPAVAPEMWVNRIAEVWNGAMDAQMVRSAAPTYTSETFEGWYMPSYMSASFAGAPSAANLAAALPAIETNGKLRFISCPSDWACAVINRNLIKAEGLENLVELVEPANRFEMDRMIGEAVNRKEPFLFYYWQPNAILAQLDFVALDMGGYDDTAAKCLATRACAEPKPSAFASDSVVIALSERVFTDTPAIAGYFQRASLSLEVMDGLLAELSQPEATPEAVADRFVAQHKDVWGSWVSGLLP